VIAAESGCYGEEEGEARGCGKEEEEEGEDRSCGEEERRRRRV